MEKEFVEYDALLDLFIVHGFSKFKTPHGDMLGWETVQKMWMPYTPDKPYIAALPKSQANQRKAWSALPVRVSYDTGDIEIKNYGIWTRFDLQLIIEE